MPIRNKYQRDYGITDGSFHKNFEIHVSNSLSDYKLIDDLVGSAKTSKFISTKVCQINRGNGHSNKQKLSYLMTFSRKKHQHNYRPTDGCFHKNLEIHVSSQLPKKPKKLVVKETETSIF